MVVDLLSGTKKLAQLHLLNYLLYVFLLFLAQTYNRYPMGCIIFYEHEAFKPYGIC
jgi:hypothetical protein